MIVSWFNLRCWIGSRPPDRPRETFAFLMVTGLIVAAGRGTRMGPNMDKLFLEIAGYPLIAHTWWRIASLPAIDELILVVRQGMESAFMEIARQLHLHKPYRLIPGGAERQDSVWNGLEAASPQTEIVVIQDGARPCTSGEVLLKSIEVARRMGAAVAGQRVTDTLKEAAPDGRIDRTVDRSRLWSVQTPQTFRYQVIRDALRVVRERGLHVTDDTAACELIAQPVTIVESAAPNPKATSPADLSLIQVLIQQDPTSLAATMPKFPKSPCQAAGTNLPSRD